MVKAPVVAASETGLPETMPTVAVEMMPTLAGPPWYLPAKALARLMKMLPTPLFSMKVPNRMNRNT
ncbi:hypothetical protein D3C80_1711600 [compost metagenome]